MAGGRAWPRSLAIALFAAANHRAEGESGVDKSHFCFLQGSATADTRFEVDDLVFDYMPVCCSSANEVKLGVHAYGV